MSLRHDALPLPFPHSPNSLALRSPTPRCPSESRRSLRSCQGRGAVSLAMRWKAVGARRAADVVRMEGGRAAASFPVMMLKRRARCSSQLHGGAGGGVAGLA